MSSKVVAGSTVSQRILNFDILRGFLIIIMVINHVELYPSGFDFFTGRGRLFVSTAEAFFFISGLLIGLVYRRRLTHGLKYVFKKMWARSLELYILSVALTLFFTWWAVYSNHLTIKYGLPTTIHWPEIIKNTLLFKYTYGWADFLPHFTVLMLIAPFALWLLSKGKWPLLVVLSMVGWHYRGNNFGFSWQIIFMLGMIVGYYWNELNVRISHMKKTHRQQLRNFIFVVSGVTFVYSYMSVYLLSALNTYWNHLPAWLLNFTHHWNYFNDFVWQFFQKWTMSPGRIIIFGFWFIAVYWLVNRYLDFIIGRSYGIVELFGKNSLFVYVAHALLVFIVHLIIPLKTNIISNAFFTAITLVALYGVTLIYVNLKITRNELKQSRSPVNERLNWKSFLAWNNGGDA